MSTWYVIDDIPSHSLVQIDDIGMSSMTYLSGSGYNKYVFPIKPPLTIPTPSYKSMTYLPTPSHKSYERPSFCHAFC